MTSPHQVDLAIIGGGCAGLTLGQRLANQPLGRSTIIIEPRETYHNDRTWSFWAPCKHPVTHLVSKTWTCWSYGQLHSEPRTHCTPHRPYQCIQSIDFYQWANASISASNSVELALGECVESVDKWANGWLIRTNRRDIKATHVVDTRPPNKDQLKSVKMFQCFAGQRLKKPGAFKSNQAELMTDMQADDDGFLFAYVLPLSSDEALVEATRFSEKPLPWTTLHKDLDDIKSRRSWREASILDQEQARLPMGISPLTHDNSSWVYAGTAAGGLRAASGYGFMRIQRWAQDCHDALQRNGMPIAHPPEPRFQAWMDRLFLDVLLKESARVPELFQTLYANAPVDALVRFMSDESSFFDKLHIIRSLPAGPFLRTMVRR
ncbi:MAG TPA: lycopene cyclase family protein [Wenzhouxiangella sp.]